MTAIIPSEVDETLVDPEPRRTSILRRMLRSPQAVITATILGAIILAGIFAPLLAPHDPNAASLSSINAAVGSEGHLLGADQNGRDILSRLLHSINTSSLSAVMAVTVALLVGVPAGLIGGYYSTWIRGGVEWLFSLIMTFPGLITLILLMPITGGDFRVTMALFGVLLSPGIYRIVRNQVVGVREELYVDAARVSGLSTPRILRRHILSVVRGPVIIAAAFLAGSAIGIQSGLAFLGLGSNSTPSFGAMISSGFLNLNVHPMQFLWPSAVLGVITACFVLLGNALRDALQGARPKPRRLGVASTADLHAEPDPSEEGVLLRVRGLSIAYPGPDGTRREVVRDVSLEVRAGETVGLVGESGSGKTQTAFSILGVLPQEAMVTGGRITLQGEPLLGREEQHLRTIRGARIAYVPQEPMSNLVPTYTVGSQLVAGLRASTSLSKREAKDRVLALLARCGIVDPPRVFASYPHQISGGMAQRVLIAGAVAAKPDLLIADEPTTALDVTVQAEILDLLRDLQEELGMGILLVTHNFGVVADICDTLAVMREGEVVESGPVLDVIERPAHSYTQMLLSAMLDENEVRDDAVARPDTIGTKP